MKACYLSMKEGSLFCFVVMRSTKPRCFRSCSWCLWKALIEEGCMGFGSMMFRSAVQKFLNIECFFHWKLNQIVAENFGGIGMWFWCSWKDLSSIKSFRELSMVLTQKKGEKNLKLKRSYGENMYQPIHIAKKRNVFYKLSY